MLSTTDLRRLVAPLRREVSVVLWGGRPGVDLQLGGDEDLARAERLLLHARVRRRRGAHLAALGAGMARIDADAGSFLQAAADADRALRELAKALGTPAAELAATHRRMVRSTGLNTEQALDLLRRAGARRG